MLTPEQLEQLNMQLGKPMDRSSSGIPATPENIKLEMARVSNIKKGLPAPSENRFKESIGDIKQTFGNIFSRFKDSGTGLSDISKRQLSGQTGVASGFLQSMGEVAGGLSGAFGDVITGVGKLALSQEQEDKAKKFISNVGEKVATFEPVEKGIQAYQQLQQENPELARNLESIVNIGMFATDVFGSKLATKGLKAITEGAEAGLRGGLKIGGEAIEGGVKASKKILDEPMLKGAINEAKIMAGLPDSAPAVEMTFRAVKPRLKKGMDLRNIKKQYEVGNQSIVKNGFKPENIKEYADAVYGSKKKVWNQIQSKLDKGQLSGLEIDLSDISNKILERANDPALLRVNPNASKQLTKIAEDLVSQGDTTDILTAEKVKQFLNAELDDAFGVTDLSQQAKEGKKLITREIGNQLDNKLSSLPDEFRKLKKEYGSLSSMEDDILKRAIVFERQNPEGLADILTKTEAAAEIAFGSPKSKLKGIARLTMGAKLKKANNADELIKRAFEKLNKEMGVSKLKFESPIPKKSKVK